MANNVVRKRPLHRILLAAGMWLIPVVAVIFGAGNWLPPLASEHGAGIDGILRYLLITVGALLVIGHLVLGYFILRFGGQERVGPFRMPSARTERMWSLVPVVILALVAEGGVLVLGLPVWDKFYASAAPADSVVIEVTAEQFAWNVRYSGPDGKFGPTDPKRITLNEPLGLDRSDPATKDDILVLNEIWVPLGLPVQILLRSKDTLHSFFLPNFRVKQDAVPGMNIQFWFVPTKVGTFELACAELCGLGHFEMRGLFHVLPREEFQKWLSEQSPAQ
ncbi:MAG: hypothetical protein A3J28_11150 [Acidobacteria bacterium RIFCSPLOWO2_12_FULL_60_22]|nr:MAG: hypothetical protein A3J28_11150 [Acidobacteria bacterium RIFCSPLOWO2_12_FULL_60_22]